MKQFMNHEQFIEADRMLSIPFSGDGLDSPSVTKCYDWMNNNAVPDYGVLQRHHMQLIGDAFELFDACRDEGIIFAFRNQHPNASQPVVLKGLHSGLAYRLEFPASEKTLVMTGQKLMETGLLVNLPDTDSSTLIRFSRKRD